MRPCTATVCWTVVSREFKFCFRSDRSDRSLSVKSIVRLKSESSSCSMKEMCETCQCGLFMFYSCLFKIATTDKCHCRILTTVSRHVQEKHPAGKQQKKWMWGLPCCDVAPGLQWYSLLMIVGKPSFSWPKMFHPKLLIIIRAPTKKPA